MSKTVINEDTGEEEVVFTQEELEAQKQEAIDALKAEHEEALKKKTEDIINIKKGNENKQSEYEKKAEEALKEAQEAKTQVQEERERRISTVKDFYISQYVGENAELKEKLVAEMNLLNLPATTDEEIATLVQKGAMMAGLGNSSSQPHQTNSGGAYAPLNTTSNASAQDNETFKKEFGFDWMTKM